MSSDFLKEKLIYSIDTNCKYKVIYWWGFLCVDCEQSQITEPNSIFPFNFDLVSKPSGSELCSLRRSGKDLGVS